MLLGSSIGWELGVTLARRLGCVEGVVLGTRDKEGLPLGTEVGCMLSFPLGSRLGCEESIALGKFDVDGS